MKENIKAPRHWPLWGEFTGDRWIPRTEGQWRGKCFHLMTSSCHIFMSLCHGPFIFISRSVGCMVTDYRSPLAVVEIIQICNIQSYYTNLVWLTCVYQLVIVPSTVKAGIFWSTRPMPWLLDLAPCVARLYANILMAKQMNGLCLP